MRAACILGSMNYDNYDCRIHIAPPRAAQVLRRKHAQKGRGASKAVARVLKAARKAVAAGAAVLALAASAQAQFIFQPTTEAASKDTKIYQHTPTMNFSTNLNITSNDVGSQFLSLLEFDLSTLPTSSADITSAVLTLYSTGLGPSGVVPAIGGDVSVSPILNPWRENSADPGSAPLATYNAFFGTTPTLAFGAPVATETVTGAGFYEWDITNLVKSWVDGSQPNHGLFIQLTTPGGDIGFADADSNPTIAGSSPSLTVVPEPGSALLAGLGGMVFFARRRARQLSAR